MVASTSGDCPHLVTTPNKFTGQFKCDSKCPMFNTYKLCVHTIATAEVTGKLSEFTQWLAKQKVTPNYNKLALHGLPKGAGQKGGIPKPKRKRKREVGKKTVVDQLAVHHQSSVCSRQDQHLEGGSCFTTAATLENVQNTWMSSYHMLTNVQPNMMHSLPSQMPIPPWLQSTPTPSPLQSSWHPSTSGSCVISPYPFTLKFLNSRIQICQSS